MESISNCKSFCCDLKTSIELINFCFFSVCNFSISNSVCFTLKSNLDAALSFLACQLNVFNKPLNFSPFLLRKLYLSLVDLTCWLSLSKALSFRREYQRLYLNFLVFLILIQFLFSFLYIDIPANLLLYKLSTPQVLNLSILLPFLVR